ncbi:MAG TPA: lanthionine synthetase LanC family protein [Bacteroidia bacterium]|jgi:lantibiotic modifying enzyme|nr:lanthionine synthetase LanC family protein [Bacteroidia bacterium]
MALNKDRYTAISNKLSEIYGLCSSVIPDKNNLSFLDGSPSMLLFCLQYENAYSINNGHSARLFDKLFQDLSNANNYPFSFCDGVLGLNWMLSYVNKKNYARFDYSAITNLCFTYLDNYFEELLDQKNVDYLHGAGGFILSIEKLDPKYIAKYLNAFEKTGGYLLIEDVYKNKDESGDVFYNLGLSHGYPSYMGLLSTASQENSYLEEVSRLKKMLDTGKLNNKMGLFPDRLSFDKESFPSRLGWCYGDMGVACAIAKAASTYNNKIWEAESIEIMLHASKRRDLIENGIVDACFCHGTSGVAHIFNRFYKKTKIEELNEARWYWFDQTLKMDKFPDAPAGYKAWEAESGWLDEYGIIEGVAGIGLSLLGFLTEDIEIMDWDKCLLIS